MANPSAKPVASTRDIRAVSKAFTTALDMIAEPRRPAVMKAAMQKIQADAKALREKQAVERMKAKAKEAAAKAKSGVSNRRFSESQAIQRIAGPDRNADKASKATTPQATQRIAGRKRAVKKVVPPAPLVPANGAYPDTAA